jgi:phosphoglycerol geranylgeranyltransferase
MFAPMGNILHQLQEARARKTKLMAVLIDPDHGADEAVLERTVQNACMAKTDMLFVGGSLLSTHGFDACVQRVREMSDRPVVLFPGSTTQLSRYADAVLFLSLISGRNAELLIGQQVTAAPQVKALGLEAVPTGYMLVDGGTKTTAHYVSQSAPIPHDKPRIAATTALAGELLGLRAIYLDTGSGARKAVSPDMVAAVRSIVGLPIIVGGGIRNVETARTLCTAGADMIVVGTAIEQEPDFVFALREAVHG